MSVKSQILINAYALKNVFSGIGTFTDQLFNSILTNNRAQKYDFTFYISPKSRNYFGKNYPYIDASRMHQYWNPFKEKYDLVHFTDQFFKRLEPRKFTAKTMVTVHDLNFMHEPGKNSAKRAKYLKKVTNHLLHVDKIVAISNYVKEDILRYVAVSPEKIVVIHNGANCPALPSLEFRPDYFPQKPFLFSIGTINPKKNWHVILPLLKYYEGDYILAGEPSESYVASMQMLAKQYGVENKLKIIPPISNESKNWYYHHCEAFMFPSLAEGFGLPVIEAMNCGKPVFISNKTSLPEIGGEVAFTFDDFDEETMLSVFQRGMDTYYADRHHYIDIAQQHASQFSWEACAQQYIDVYESLLTK